MSATVKPSDVDPTFFERRPVDVNWTLRVRNPDGTVASHVGVDWEASSRFGSVGNRVVLNPETGEPMFDRPEYREAKNINAIVWGRDSQTGKVRIGMLHEQRPHADNPFDPRNKEGVVFGQIPMGFLDKILGKGYESSMEGAGREVAEEAGAKVVKGIIRPFFPYQNMSPSFLATWNELLFIEVDLEQIEMIKPQHGEIIYKAEYISVPELLGRICEGEHDGAMYRNGNSNALLMIFFATFPQFFTV